MAVRKVRLKRRKEPERVTKKGLFLFVGLVLFSLVAFVAAIRMGVEYRNSELASSSDLRTKGLYYQLKMERTNYRQGEPIEIQLSVTNITSEPIDLLFERSLEFNLVVRKEVDLLFAQIPKTVWSLSDTQMVVADPHTRTLKAGETVTFSGTWNQKDRDDKLVQPGQYQIIGSLLAKGRPESLQLRSRAGEES